MPLTPALCKGQLYLLSLSIEIELPLSEDIK